MAKPRKDPAAVSLGRLGGKAKSAKKAAAARANGKKGGRPKKKKKKTDAISDANAFVQSVEEYLRNGGKWD